MNILSLNITTAKSAELGPILQTRGSGFRELTVEAVFVYGGSGGTSVDAYVQTSFDGGTTWCDVCNFHSTTSSASGIYNLSSATPVTSIATPSDGGLSANSAVDGLLGNFFRTKWTSVGTYSAGTTLSINAIAPGLTV